MGLQEIKKTTLLNSIRDGGWILDVLINFIEKEFKNPHRDQCLTYKELNIFYYGNIKTSKIPSFVNPDEDLNFSSYILSRINRDGELIEFSTLQKNKIEQSVKQLQPILNGGMNFVENLSFVNVDSQSYRSASSPHLLGIIVLTSKINFEKKYNLSKSIIHELGHQELFLLNFIDPIVKANDTNLSAFSPYQETERPPIGRIHSLYALYRMIQHEKYFNNNYDFELRMFNQTLDTLDGCLTPFGEELVNSLTGNII